MRAGRQDASGCLGSAGEGWSLAIRGLTGGAIIPVLLRYSPAVSPLCVAVALIPISYAQDLRMSTLGLEDISAKKAGCRIDYASVAQYCISTMKTSAAQTVRRFPFLKDLIEKSRLARSRSIYLTVHCGQPVALPGLDDHACRYSSGGAINGRKETHYAGIYDGFLNNLTELAGAGLADKVVLPGMFYATADVEGRNCGFLNVYVSADFLPSELPARSPLEAAGLLACAA